MRSGRAGKQVKGTGRASNGRHVRWGLLAYLTFCRDLLGVLGT